MKLSAIFVTGIAAQGRVENMRFLAEIVTES